MKTETHRDRKPDPLRDHASYQDVARECDVVMKGGVTSGIVYPRAICKLAQRFRLRSIGGASAGAIAAACAAAAEVGRVREGAGFTRLAELPERLGEPMPGAASRLVSLFQPSAATRILFELLLALTGPAGRLRKTGRAAWTLAWHGGWFALGGAAIVVALPLFFAVREPGSAWLWVMAAIGAAVGGVLGGACRAILALVRAVPRQMFGICSGRTADGRATPGLTDWLHAELQALAGLEANAPPLTFDALRAHGVALEVVTTCLTHGRPYVFPGLRRTLYFDPDEFRRLFPTPVVDHLVAIGNALVARDRLRPNRALEHACMQPRLPLPRQGELPVLVAVRMSLSFPLLLSAVPLWDYDWGGDGVRRESVNQSRRRAWRAWRTKHPEEWLGFLTSPHIAPEGAPRRLVPERIWFSDGGISSNFPLHLFDSPVPTRPTVAIDLRYHANGEALDSRHRVQLAQDNADGIDESWTRFVAPEAAGHGGVLAFAARIFATMQNWTDTTLAKSPGYRDRFAAVHLQADEGGMNLAMGEEQIAAIARYGEQAGADLAARFTKVGAGAELTWTGHRWVRLRTSLAAFEAWLSDFVAGIEHEVEPSYDALIQRKSSEHPTNYPLTAAQRALFTAVLDQLRTIRATLPADGKTLTDRAPRPTPTLRLAPRMNFPAPDDGSDAT